MGLGSTPPEFFKRTSELADRFPTPTSVFQNLSESSDICPDKTYLTSTELRKLREEQDPLVQCAVCEGYNYNCPKYHSLEDPQVDINIPSQEAFL
jgi:hypothetical protein